MSNVLLNAGSGGATLGTDTVTGTPNVDYQIVKIGYSATGVAPTQVSSANPLPSAAYFSGTAASANTGNADAGTLRVVLATNQPALSNAQPVLQSGSWTVTVNGEVADATAFTRGTTGFFPGGGVVEAVQSGLTVGQARAFSLTTGALLRVDASGATVPVSGTFWQATQPVSGTVTANQGTANSLANAWTTELTDGTNGPAAVKAASTAAVAADKALVVAVSPNNSVAVTGTFWQATQPVSGTITANQGGNWTARVVGNGGATLDAAVGAGTAPANGVAALGVFNTTPVAPTAGQSAALQLDSAGNLRSFGGIALTTLAAQGTALNSTQTIIANGASGAEAVMVQLTQTTTLTAGAITFEVTYDGTNWSAVPAAFVVDPTSGTYAQIAIPYTVQASTNKQFLILLNGGTGLRIRTSTAITGTGSVTPNYALLNYQPLEQVSVLGTVAVTESGTWTVQPGNTANTTPWLTTNVPGTSPGSTLSRIKAAASTNSTNLKGSAGVVLGYSLYNNTASAKFFKFYNKATAPTVGTDTPAFTVIIPASGGANVSFETGIPFGTGIGYGITGAVADSDATNTAVDDVHGMVLWK